MKRKQIISTRQLAAAGAALAALQAGPVVAETDDGQLTINASVVAQCFVNDATMNFSAFGILDSAGTLLPASTSADIGVICTNGTNGTVYAGANTVTLTAGAETLLVGLYEDSAAANPFPAAEAGGVEHLGTGTLGSIPVYGKITPLATTKAGAYTGTVALTISY